MAFVSRRQCEQTIFDNLKTLRRTQAALGMPAMQNTAAALEELDLTEALRDVDAQAVYDLHEELEQYRKARRFFLVDPVFGDYALEAGLDPDAVRAKVREEYPGFDFNLEIVDHNAKNVIMILMNSQGEA